VNRERLAKRALHKALDIRRNSDVGLSSPLDIYDFTEDQGIEVRFLDTPSMEGIYTQLPRPVIIITSDRPSGRKRYTCAHELGHHVFEHGSTIDALIEGPSTEGGYNSEEFLADAFAGFLLMPKVALHHAVDRRDWSFDTLGPRQIYILAGNFGVGYSTLIKHLRSSLELISPSKAEHLRNTEPRDIRRSILGKRVDAELFFVDHEWEGRPVDIEVGDLVLTESDIHVESDEVHHLTETSNGSLHEAATPGIGRLVQHERGWATFLRVSRSSYEGRSQYRHLEEID